MILGASRVSKISPPEISVVQILSPTDLRRYAMNSNAVTSEGILAKKGMDSRKKCNLGKHDKPRDSEVFTVEVRCNIRI